MVLANGKEKQLKLLEKLRQLDASGTEFTTGDVASGSEYQAGTINKYFNEKLKGRCLTQVTRSLWKCDGLNKLSNDEFLNLLSQSVNAKIKSPDEVLFGQLMKRSHEAFTLALEMYNRPTLGNRVEAFTIMMVNAWELMLKAELVKVDGTSSIFEEGNFSIPVRKALSRCVLSNSDLVKNLEVMIDLRDQAIHLLIPELQPKLSLLFQATVLNYQKRYKDIMGNSPLEGQSVGLLSLIVDGSEPEVAVIKEHYGELTANQVKEFLGKFTELTNEHNSDVFAISVDYKLALTKKQSDADLSLSNGPGGKDTIIVHQTKDAAMTHPFHLESARGEINARQSKYNITRWSFLAVITKHKIQSGSYGDFHYQLDNRHRYSHSFINWFLKNLEQDGWLESASDSYKKSRSKKSKSRA
ncbi:DUF3644 domain-containing protein [Vibrio lentus]|nr:DUF3644 domain-containing protein [Vibrio lentus]